MRDLSLTVDQHVSPLLLISHRVVLEPAPGTLLRWCHAHLIDNHAIGVVTKLFGEDIVWIALLETIEHLIFIPGSCGCWPILNFTLNHIRLDWHVSAISFRFERFGVANLRRTFLNFTIIL